MLLIERKIVVDWAVPRVEKGNSTLRPLKVKEGPEERPEFEPEEESSDIKTEKKLEVLGTEVVQNTETKKCKKRKKAKKGRLIVRNLPFKVHVAINLRFSNLRTRI